MKKFFFLLIIFFGILFFGKIALATTLIDENFNNRSFNNGIMNVYNEPGGYCTGLGCPWGTVSRGGTGYSLQGSHDVSGYNIMLATAADPWDYMQTGFYYRYYLYFPTSYWFAPECAGYANYQNQKLFKFAGVGDLEGGLIYDAGTGAVTSVYMQFSKEDGNTDSGRWYPIPSGHYMFKNQWNKIEMYIKIPPTGSYNSTIHLAINGGDTILLTNETVYKGSYSSARQMQSVRVTGGPPYAPMPPSGHGTWYLDDLKIVYGEGDLIGLDGTGDPTPPSTPTNLTATAVSSSQINLSWTSSTDNVGVTGYKIYRCFGSGCTPSTELTTTASASYSDTGLTANTTYVYRVAAYDAAGNVSGQSSSASATTQAPTDTTPPVISNGSPTGTLPVGTTQTTMSVITNENATCRYSTIAGTAYSSMTGRFLTAPGTNHSTSLIGLTYGQTYNFYIRCQDTAGNANTSDYTVNFSVASSADTTAPAAPTGVTII